MSNNDEDFITSLITCKVCNQIFDDPVIMPCHKTLCSKHIIELMTDSIYKCFFCSKEHKIDLKELITDEEKLELIRRRNDFIDINSFDFGENHTLARDACDLYDEALKEAKLLVVDPDNFVHILISDLKNKADLTRESLKYMIETNYERVMNQIIDLEQELKSKSHANVYSMSLLVQEFELKLNNWTKMLKELDPTKESEWKEIRFEACKDIRQIKEELDKCKDNLLFNKEYTFVPVILSVNNNFGNISIRNNEKGKISLVINDFSKLQPTDPYKTSGIHLINKIPWSIEAGIEVINEKEYLRCIIKVNYSLPKLKYNPIYARITYKIVQFEARKSGSIERTETYKFDNKTLQYTISKEQIMNLFYGLYDLENDLITVEVDIKVL
jgi:hypothetical protein